MADSRADGHEGVAGATPLLAVVIITRNEESTIGACIEAVLESTASLMPCEVVMVDSDSDDHTIEIARKYPVRVVQLSSDLRHTPAMGRHVGFSITNGRYVLFVDGDSTIVPVWLPAALEILRSRLDVAALAGREDQVYYASGSIAGGKRDYFGTGDTETDVEQLGGNGIYRRDVLEQVGSFNPFLRSYEEAELGVRIRHAGWRIVRAPALMAEHHTVRPDAVSEYWRRLRRHLLTGQGQVLRLAVQAGSFRDHARQLNRLLLYLLWLGVGAIAAVTGAWLASAAPLLMWLAGGVLLLLAFVLRSRSLTKPLRMLLDWSICVPPLVWGFLLRPRDGRAFDLARAVAVDSAALGASTRGGEAGPRSALGTR